MADVQICYDCLFLLHRDVYLMLIGFSFGWKSAQTAQAGIGELRKLAAFALFEGL